MEGIVWTKVLRPKSAWSVQVTATRDLVWLEGIQRGGGLGDEVGEVGGHRSWAAFKGPFEGLWL